MRNPRFHIASVCGVVLFLGVGFAALRESTDLWDCAIFTLALGVLLVSILLAVHRSKKRRAFWIGFALFGWGYLVLSLIRPIESRLLTTKALAFIDSKRAMFFPGGLVSFDYNNDGLMDIYVANDSQSSLLFRNTGNGTFQDVTATSGLNLPANQPEGNRQYSFFANSAGILFTGSAPGTTENFVRIGHSLLALIAAFVGGQMSRHFYVKMQDDIHDHFR
jgi:hypothetical protein